PDHHARQAGRVPVARSVAGRGAGAQPARGPAAARRGGAMKRAVAGMGARRPWAQASRWRVVLGVAMLALFSAPARRSGAYDPATTHAGLTQQAAVASGLHQILVRRLARPLGLFEQVALHPELMPRDARRLLLARLGALDPFAGYRPDDDGVATALGFVVAGSVIAKTPPERVQHLFF